VSGEAARSLGVCTPARLLHVGVCAALRWARPRVIYDGLGCSLLRCLGAPPRAPSPAPANGRADPSLFDPEMAAAGTEDEQLKCTPSLLSPQQRSTPPPPSYHPRTPARCVAA
jgi:hypothetical protein